MHPNLRSEERDDDDLRATRPTLDTARFVAHDCDMKRAEVFEQALSLPEDARLDLAAELLASAGPAPAVLAEGDPRTAAEIRRRIQAVRQGDVQSIPADEALARLRRRPRG